jgi:two-component system, OmpR family, KDP operon response regulator KdpE
MAMQPLILIIEDDTAIRRLLRVSLADAGYRLNEAADGAEGVRLAAEYPPDAVILDLGLPSMDGQEVIRRIREWSQVPIIVLSAREQESQKIQALDNGADDFVSKPFSPAELAARIRVALRRTGPVKTSSVVTFGSCRVDLGARIVYRDQQEVHLTPIEYKLLVTLINNADKVLTHRFLLREVWGPSDSTESHYVRVFIATLRRKLEKDTTRPQFILTEPGVGYRFTKGPDEPKAASD